MIWYSRKEINAIKKFGGKPLRKDGFDGTIRGRPVEVKSIRKDYRFRIQRDAHRNLLKQKGSYIFCGRGGRIKRVSARVVTKLMPKGRWYKDRKYPHKFVTRKGIFG